MYNNADFDEDDLEHNVEYRDCTFESFIAQSNPWAQCSEILILPLDPSEKKRYFSKMTNSKKQKTANKFEYQKSTDNVSVCRRIAVKAATK